jgi:hypothetical protein
MRTFLSGFGKEQEKLCSLGPANHALYHFGTTSSPYLTEIAKLSSCVGNRANRPFGIAIALLSVHVGMSADGEWILKKVLLPVLLVGLSSAFAWTLPARADDVPDPVGFCPPVASVPACTTANGVGNETIAVGSTSIGMEKNGSGLSSSPWYLLVAVPNYTGAAPTLSIAGFTESATVNSATFLPTTSGSIYDLYSLVGDSSMNASNLFGANEVAAFGGTPTSFDVFEYSFTGAFNSCTPYAISVSGAGLSAGTYLAASGGSNPFSTPFTTTGLVGGTIVQTPEPGSLAMLGIGLLGLASLVSRRSLTV